MSQYIEPYIVFFLSILLCNYTITDATNIILLLCAFISVSFLVISKSKKGNTAITVFSIILAVVFAQYIVFLPALLYNPVLHKKYYPCLAYVIPVAVCLASGPSLDILYVLILSALSAYLAYSTAHKNDLIRQINILRDTAVEHEISLKEQNRKIIEGQNDQIYVATLQERNRIAREIHDNVGHMLSSSILQVGALISVSNGKGIDETIIQLLHSLKDTLNLAMDNIRNSVHDLHDESVDLNQSLKNLCERFSFCPVSLQCDVSRFIPKDIKYCFITIANEALNNIIKHSNATQVNVIVKEHPGFYQLLIEDNGTKARGKTPEEISANGIGLKNMEERVNSLHGILRIQTDKGFKIFISIPKQK